MKLLIYIILLTTFLFSESSKCPQFFLNGKSPDIKIKHQELCFEQFVVSYNVDYKNPLFAAEMLNKDTIKMADLVKRKDAFHQEKRIPLENQVSLSAFPGTKFDRGHVIPAADMSTLNAQYESFSTVNITPQDSNNNRDLWKKLEGYTRDLAKKYDTVYMISGPIFTANPNKMKDGTSIPDGYFKIVYIKQLNKVSSFYCKNLPKQKYELKSIKEIEALTGYKFVQFNEEIKNKSELIK